MNPCCGCLQCHGYKLGIEDGKPLHTIDCTHFKRQLSMPDTHTKFYCLYFELDD
jgi:hypothetical protein